MNDNFLLLAGLAGGAAIGLGAAVMLYFNGRIAGISGILGGMLQKVNSDTLWRLAFLLGMPAGVWLTTLVRGTPLTIELNASPLLLIIAGLLVGFGTRLGSGCTSGHGVCGLARLSPRSLAATATFMAVAALTVYVMRHVVGG
jgi:uncharacterized membrane protein YedE/YeeE